MSRDDLIGVIIGLLFTLSFALYSTIKAPEQEIEKFLKGEWHKDIITKAFKLSIDIVQIPFGPTIISWRSFGVSVGISSLVCILAFMVAYLTTPWLHLVTGTVYDFIVSYDSLLSGVTFTCTILFTLFAEYLYISKTRWLIKHYCRDATRLSFILGIFCIDIVSTYIMLTIVTCLIIILSLYAVETAPSYLYSESGTYGFPINHNMTFNVEFINSATKDSDGSLVFFGLETKFNPSKFLDVTRVCKDVILALYFELKSYFEAYFYVDVSFPFEGDYIVPDFPGFPLTTFFFSAFFTTIWISGVTLFLLLLRFARGVEYSFGLGLRHILKPQYAFRYMCWSFALGCLLIAFLIVTEKN